MVELEKEHARGQILTTIVALFLLVTSTSIWSTILAHNIFREPCIRILSIFHYVKTLKHTSTGYKNKDDLLSWGLF